MKTLVCPYCSKKSFGRYPEAGLKNHVQKEHANQIATFAQSKPAKLPKTVLQPIEMVAAVVEDETAPMSPIDHLATALAELQNRKMKIAAKQQELEALMADAQSVDIQIEAVKSAIAAFSPQPIQMKQEEPVPA